MSGDGLAEFYTKPSEAWRTGSTEIIRFWTDDGDCWGFGFHRLSGAHYNAPTERLLIDFDMATVAIAGPETLRFFDHFCDRQIISLKADGKDITSVTVILKSEKSLLG